MANYGTWLAFDWKYGNMQESDGKYTFQAMNDAYLHSRIYYLYVYVGSIESRGTELVVLNQYAWLQLEQFD